jgi:hypothetical protein
MPDPHGPIGAPGLEPAPIDADWPPGGAAGGDPAAAPRPACRGAGATLAWLAAVAVVAALAAQQAATLFLTYLDHPRLPLWDMAEHARHGVVLSLDLQEGRLGGFLSQLNRQSTWPFAYSLYLTPFLLVGGHGFVAATLANTVLFALGALVLLLAARELDDGPAGLTAGVLAAALFLVSPLPRAFGLLIMRELAGVVLSVLAFGLYLRALRRGTLGAYRGAGVAALALFFVKYNYGVLWLLSVAIHQLAACSADARARLLRAIGAWVWPWPTRDPFRIVVALGVYALPVLAADRRWVATFVYGVVVAGAAVAAWRLWSRAPDVARWWRALPPPARAAVETLLVPIWLWCLGPKPLHVRDIVGTLTNRSSGIPLLSSDGLFYYVQAFGRDYAPDPRVGGAVLAAALVSGVGLWRSGEPFRVLGLAAGVQLLAIALHPFKQPRFLMTAVPFVLLLAAAGVTRAACRAGGRGGPWLLAGVAATAAVSAAGWLGQPAAQARLVADYATYSGDPRLAAVLEFIDAAVPREGRLGVIGVSNDLSPDLIRSTLLRRRVRQAFTVVRQPRRLPPDAGGERVRATLGEWVARQRPDQIVGIRLTPSSPYYATDEYQRVTAGQLRGLAALAEEAGWRPGARREFPELGLEVAVLVRAGATGASP